MDVKALAVTAGYLWGFLPFAFTGGRARCVNAELHLGGY